MERAVADLARADQASRLYSSKTELHHDTIGPGTGFMATFQEKIEFYIKKRRQEN